jgi:hypothetical protein
LNVEVKFCDDEEVFIKMTKTVALAKVKRPGDIADQERGQFLFAH